jgi:hypothetical protein
MPRKKKEQTHLTNEQLLRMQIFDLKEQLAQKEIELAEKDARMADLEQALSVSKITLRKKVIKEKVDMEKNRKGSIAQQRKEFITTIGKELNMEEGFGFDPDSGEIIRKEDSNE